MKDENRDTYVSEGQLAGYGGTVEHISVREGKGQVGYKPMDRK